jgi:hypothetical protein
MALPKAEEKGWVQKNLLPNQDNWLWVIPMYVIALGVAGYFAQRRGYVIGKVMMAPAVLIAISAVLNLIGVFDIGAKK